MPEFGAKVFSEKKPGEELLDFIAQRMNLPQGAVAVKNYLIELKKAGIASGKKLAGELQLPFPVVAKIKNELVKQGLVDEGLEGVSLTAKGRQFIEDLSITTAGYSLACKSCNGKTVTLNEALQKAAALIDELQAKRKPKMLIDQNFVTGKSSALRAALMLESNDLEGKKIAFIGDSDLTSIAAASLGVARKITVFDIDDELLSLISRTAKERRLAIECVRQDFREELKSNEKFDVFSTDPPYTFDGLKAFLAAGKNLALIGYLTFSMKTPNELLSVQKILLDEGFNISLFLPAFNEGRHFRRKGLHRKAG
ncbi:bis-aminopropyl spermidine synthase family protein [archaeon]|nr:bis-aminopropyl spermidine synthase family protein [archaeon]